MAATSTVPATRPGAAGGRRRRRSEPQPFDFRRPTTFSREHARALQIVNETFARQFTTILSTTLRSVSQVSVASIDHVSYDEYVRSSPELAFLALLSIDPLPGAGILQLPLDIAMAAIDRLLGGTGGGGQPSRALTDTVIAWPGAAVSGTVSSSSSGPPASSVSTCTTPSRTQAIVASPCGSTASAGTLAFTPGADSGRGAPNVAAPKGRMESAAT